MTFRRLSERGKTSRTTRSGREDQHSVEARKRDLQKAKNDPRVKAVQKAAMDLDRASDALMDIGDWLDRLINHDLSAAGTGDDAKRKRILAQIKDAQDDATALMAEFEGRLEAVKAAATAVSDVLKLDAKHSKLPAYWGNLQELIEWSP